MSLPKPGASVRNWTPAGGSKESKGTTKLMGTEARDAKDTMNGSNELKEFVGKSGKPSGPFGTRGRGF